MWTGVSVSEFVCVCECVNAGMRESGSVRVGTGILGSFYHSEIIYEETMVSVGIFARRCTIHPEYGRSGSARNHRYFPSPGVRTTRLIGVKSVSS